MQGTQKMKEGPSTGIEQASLSNHSNAAVIQVMVVSDWRKGYFSNQIRYMKMNASEPLMKCRKRKTSAKPIFHHWVGKRIAETCKADYLRNGIKMA